jgi:hypothetical protein
MSFGGVEAGRKTAGMSSFRIESFRLSGMVLVERKFFLVLLSCVVGAAGLSACSSAKDVAEPSSPAPTTSDRPPPPSSSTPSASSSAEAPAQDVVAQIIRKALRTDGSVSLGELLRELGPPQRVATEARANAYQPDQTDTLRTLVYPGLRALVYDVSGSPKTFLIRLSLLTKRYATPEGLRVGDTGERALRVLGSPTRRNSAPDEWIYSESDSMPTAMILTLRNRTITRIDWEFYFS